MYVYRARPRLAVIVFVLVAATAWSAGAQTWPPAEPHEHGQATVPATGDHAAHDMTAMAREGSGTAWLPDTTPMYAVHRDKGAWQLMGHENLFLQYFHESGDRGADQVGSINWVMGMANRNLGAGRLGLRGMFSLEPWTIGGCGYPDLLASGESCEGEKIHDRQHPHDLAMEVSASYDAPITGAVRWQVYGGPAGEPALGPVAFPHRVSAMPNPVAPMSHHWLDSTHISFGVVTGAVYGNRWKGEVSAFNGREPDEERGDFDFGALDSVSGRLSFLPTPNLALQLSSGRLTEAEASEAAGAPAIDVTRVTASATYHRAIGNAGIWANTAAWGRNAELDHSTHALLLESSVTLDDRDTWFGRFEVAGKTAHDLDVPGDDIFTVTKLQGGYTRYFPAWNSVKPGLGFSVSAGVVPDPLKAAYGSRANVGFGVFITLRPPAMMHAAALAGAGGAAPVDHSQHVMPPASTAAPTPPAAPAAPAPADNAPRLPVAALERIVDPRCAATIDMINAPRATHEGKVYYFCSAEDRDAFVKDPAAYLNRRPNR
jgi:YHS domain-containing protein